MNGKRRRRLAGFVAPTLKPVSQRPCEKRGNIYGESRHVRASVEAREVTFLPRPSDGRANSAVHCLIAPRSLISNVVDEHSQASNNILSLVYCATAIHINLIYRRAYESSVRLQANPQLRLTFCTVPNLQAQPTPNFKLPPSQPTLESCPHLSEKP